MPDRVDKCLLLLGLFIFSIGQCLIYAFGASTKSTSPIDVSHWLMLIGAVFYLPFAMRLPRHGGALFATILITIGVVSVIGMCVIDFVFWALVDDELRGAVARELSETPLIWQSFMIWGSEEVLMIGFVLASLAIPNRFGLGTAFILAGAIMASIGSSWFNFLSYIHVIVGFCIIFFTEARKTETL